MVTVELHYGECLELMKDIPSGSVDLILCDLPYGTTACKWDSVIPFEPLWEQYRRKTRATGHLNAKKIPMKDIEDVLVFYACPPTYNPQGLAALGKVQKNSASDMARGVSSDPTSVVTGGITRGTYVQEATGYPRQVLDFPSEGNTVHPTQKPVALMEYLIRTYTNEGETVLDNCMGSGTTGVACANTGRNFIGIEQDAGYFLIAAERIHNAKP